MDGLTVREVARASGIAPVNVREGMRAAGTEDPALGVGYYIASTLAVVYRGDRHGWNLNVGQVYADRIRSLVADARAAAVGSVG